MDWKNTHFRKNGPKCVNSLKNEVAPKRMKNANKENDIGRSII
jgi:hypothetical protein